MQLIRSLFFSIPAMVVMLSVFALAIGTATFIETFHDSETARAVIYNAWWMTVLYVLIAMNLFYNIIRVKLWRKEKWLSGLFHTAFLLILFGAALTRYFGEGGILHFREGEIAKTVLSSRSYFQATLSSGLDSVQTEKALWLSRITPVQLSKQMKLKDQSVIIQCKEFVPRAMPVLVENESGGPVALFSVSEGDLSYPLAVQTGDERILGSVPFVVSEQAPDSGDFIQLFFEDEVFKIRSSLELNRFSMREGIRDRIAPLTEFALKPGMLISSAEFQFAMQTFLPRGWIGAEPVTSSGDPMQNDYLPDALLVNVLSDQTVQQAALFGGSGVRGEPVRLQTGEADLVLSFGSKELTLPFGLELIDFTVERYPGSRMPSGFSSEVIIHDKGKGIERPFQIYMNHILKYRGYRFFQSSFDEDEAGSVLSVSHDPGTIPTYVGYLLCVVALIFNLFNPNSRFRKLAKRISANHAAMILLFVLGFGFLTSASVLAQDSTDDAVALVRNIEKLHSREFGRLIVQDTRGRMKPLNSLSHEIMHQLGYPNRFLEVHPDQLVLALWLRPQLSQSLPLIPVTNSTLKRRLGMTPSETHIAVTQMKNAQTQENRLRSILQSAESKDARKRNAAEQEALDIRERIRFCHLIGQGGLFRIFPVAEVPTQRWTAYVGVSQLLDSTQAAPVLKLAEAYQSEIENALVTDQWHRASTALLDIQAWQTQYGANVLPSSLQSRVEIFYNEIGIFHRVALWAFMMGLALLVFETIQMLRYFKWLGRMAWLSSFGLVVCFVFATGGLILRWIAAAHPPWSNKYESVIYISWTILLAGVVFLRQSRMALAGAGMLSGLLLTISKTASFDPRITNLHPVLKSHWLITHVSVITASYGFFGLGAVLGLITLVLLLFRGHKREQGLASPMLAMNRVIEQSLLLGLVLVTIGNFFGAVWANESWGRYWGWDPKETWTLIVILIYTVVLHMHLIPKFNTPYALATGSVLAFSTVVFTYVGVNLYLSGMHSYAAGEKPTLPIGFYLGIALILLIIVFAGRKKKG